MIDFDQTIKSIKDGIEITDMYLKQGHIINGIKMISQTIKSEKSDEHWF